MWFPPEDGAELYDFELEPGGRSDEWGYCDQRDELRRLILYLVREKNSLLVKLRGLSTLREVLQSRNAKQGQEQTNFYEVYECIGGGKLGAENSQDLTVSAGACAQMQTRQTQRAEKLQRDEGPVSFKDDKKQDVCTSTDSFKNTDLIRNLQQANKELCGEIRLLKEVSCDSEANINCCERCLSYLKSQLVRYILKTRKLERALKIKDVLCSSLTEKLDVMREDKTLRTTDYASRNMNNNRVSGNNCSQLEECNGYSCSANEPDSTREQIKSAQNEGNKEKMDKTAVSGSVICSNEGHVLKTKLENVEKEFSQMKDELSKVCTEKSQLEKRLGDLRDSHDKEENALRVQISKLQQEKRQLQDTLAQYQTNEQKQKQEFDQVLYRAQEMQEMLERETQEKFASMAEQKSLRQQIENLSKNMKSLQVKSEEYVRYHCDQEDQIDDFKRLKKLIHENGLPTSIEQLIALQRQNESYREEFLNERKEKERVLSLKDKLKRDLENAQSRISSLQEQVYKYREHIFFLQQKFKQEGSTAQPSSAMLDMPSAPVQGHNLSRLYGSTATQYINEMLLQGNAQPKFPGSPIPDGKKPGPGKHGDGTGKPWQYQQGGYGRYGRQMSAEDWKQRAPSQGQSWDNFYGSNQSGRLSSASSLSSVRSGSSSSEEVPVEGQTEGRTPFGMGGMGGRRQGPRPMVLPDKAVEESRGMQQSYGPPTSPFEPWAPKPQGFAMRGQRRYSSPTGSGGRPPNSTDFWQTQQPMGGFQRSWQSPVEQAQYPDTTQAAMSSGLRPTAEPWPAAVTSVPGSMPVQSTLATSSQGDTMTFMSGGTGMR